VADATPGAMAGATAGTALADMNGAIGGIYGWYGWAMLCKYGGTNGDL